MFHNFYPSPHTYGEHLLVQHQVKLKSAFHCTRSNFKLRCTHCFTVFFVGFS